MMNLDEMYTTALVNRQTRDPVDVMRDGSERLHIAQADDFAGMATEMAGGTEPAGAKPMTLGEFATSVADVPAGLVKGAIQGTAGFAGDMVSIGRAIGAAINPEPNESSLDAFIRAIGDPVKAFGYDITTEGMKQILEGVLGPLVPEGADPGRVKAAETAEFVGEVGAMGKMATATAKTAARGAKAVSKSVKRSVATPAAETQ